MGAEDRGRLALAWMRQRRKDEESDLNAIEQALNERDTVKVALRRDQAILGCVLSMVQDALAQKDIPATGTLEDMVRALIRGVK